MSVVLSKLLDIEKYLLQQMAYYHLPIEQKDLNLSEEPIPLADLVENIVYGDYSIVTKKEADGSTREHVYRKREEFRKILNNSNNLGDVVLRGYISDNYNRYGNTASRLKTSLLGMCFADSEDNRVVVFAGCENADKLSFFIDMGGCILSGIGLPMRQQREALRFFDRETKGTAGRIGLIGHSKGGFNATHCYINRLDMDLDVFVIGGQPYNWFVMNKAQRAALKQPNYEFILHEGDVMGQAGYLTYVSRVVRVNPYRNKSRILQRHCFDTQLFDDYGNLEGARVLRKTPGAVKRLIFSDYSKEEIGSNEDALKRFENIIGEIDNTAKLISYAIDEIQLVTGADTATFFMVHEQQGTYNLVPVMTKGGAARDIVMSRMKVSESKLKNAIDGGYPVLFTDINEESHLLVEIQNTMKEEISSFGIIPVTGEDHRGGLISLASFEGGKLGLEEFDFALKLVEKVHRRLGEIGFDFEVIPAPPKFQLLRLDEPVLSVERAEYKEVFCRYKREKDEYSRVFTKGRLSGIEKILIDRIAINPGENHELRTWREKDLTFIYGGEAKEKRKPIPKFTKMENSYLALTEAADLLDLDYRVLVKGRWEMSAVDYVKVRAAYALTKESSLIVIDAWDMSEADYMEVMPVLRLLCYDMYTTVIVLRRAEDR